MLRCSDIVTLPLTRCSVWGKVRALYGACRILQTARRCQLLNTLTISASFPESHGMKESDRDAQGTFPSQLMAGEGCPEHQPSSAEGVTPPESEPEKLERPKETNRHNHWPSGQDVKGWEQFFQDNRVLRQKYLKSCPTETCSWKVHAVGD